jgi:tRNA(Ile)-lysidine synthase
MGPHPAVAEIRRAVRTALAGSTSPVLVACSGGADSLALAAALAFEAPRAGRTAGLVTVDHGLQPGSDAHAARVAALGYELGLDPVTVVRVAVGTAGGPEAAARTARYAALAAASDAAGADALLGHTLDDQAETVLLGLGRGSGPRSIAGMRPRQGCWVRPLLGVRRSVTRAACDALGLPVWDDPANEDPGFQRVRLRAEVLPLLEQVLQGGVAESLARTASLLQDDLDALDDLAGEALVRCSPSQAAAKGGQLEVGELAVEQLAQLPRALRTRVLRSWALGLGASECTAERTAALEALVSDWHGQGPVELPGGVRVVRASDRLHPL